MKQIKISFKDLRNVLNKHTSSYITTGDVDDIMDDVMQFAVSSRWWVVVLKVIAYAIGLILAGIGTDAACQSLISF